MVTTVDRPVIGKCPVKGCKQRRRNILPTKAEDRGRRYPPSWRPVFPFLSTLPSYLTVDELLRRDPSVITARTVGVWQDLGWVCQDHGYPMKLTVVVGTYDPSRACDGRCMGATGPSCDCSCGGMNHGRSWDDVCAVEVHQPV